MHTVTISLPDDAFAYLQALAAQHAQSVESFLADAVAGSYEAQRQPWCDDDCYELN